MVFLVKQDLIWCLRRLPKLVFNLMKERKGDIVLAGGFIRSCITNDKISDIDLFSKTTTDAELFTNIIAKRNDARIIKTDNAFTVVRKGNPSIQFIHRWTFSEPAKIIPSFDFTIAKAAIWFDGGNWQSLCDDNYYADLAAKRLVYCSPDRIEEVGGSMLRILKFYQRGYRIPLDSLGAVIARLMQGVDFKKVNSEIRLAEVLTGLLHEVDPNIDPTHISHLPSMQEETETKNQITEGE